jgi:hypothetical protein
LRRLRGLAAMALVIGVGCPGSTAHPTLGPTGGAPAGPGGSSTSQASPRPVLLPRLVLDADVSTPSVRWPLVATIRSGEREDELGLVTDPLRTPVPYVPRSFAVAADGSFWILDVVKKRLAHYSPGGAFLGALGGFHFDPTHSHPLDVIVSDGRLYVLEEGLGLQGIGSSLATFDARGRLTTARLRAQGRDVIVSCLFPLSGGVGGYLTGFTGEAIGTGPVGPARLNASPDGEVTLLPGFPIGPDAWMRTSIKEDQMRVTTVRGSTVTVLPILIRGAARTGGRASVFPVIAAAPAPAVTTGGVADYIPFSAARPADQRRYGGGAYLLRVGPSPLLWERLAQGDVPDSIQLRMVATGPDGALYLMLVNEQEVDIYRRP